MAGMVVWVAQILVLVTSAVLVAANVEVDAPIVELGSSSITVTVIVWG